MRAYRLNRRRIQLDGRTADLKKAMTAYMDTFGVAVACEKCNKRTVKKMN